jgi:hypothetical protein
MMSKKAFFIYLQRHCCTEKPTTKLCYSDDKVNLVLCYGAGSESRSTGVTTESHVLHRLGGGDDREVWLRVGKWLNEWAARTYPEYLEPAPTLPTRTACYACAGSRRYVGGVTSLCRECMYGTGLCCVSLWIEPVLLSEVAPLPDSSESANLEGA